MKNKKLNKSKMIKQKCQICGKEFKGTVNIDVCPSCYV